MRQSLRGNSGWVPLLLIGAASVQAQVPAATTSHALAYGIVVTLPADWTRDSIAGLRELLVRAEEWLRAPTEVRVAQLAAEFTATPLLRGSGPRGRTEGIVVIVVPTARMTARNFDVAPPGGPAELASVVCSGFEAQVRAVRATGGCTGHELRSVAGRTALVIRQRVTSASGDVDNDRAVAMVPMEGAMLTLTISIPRDAQSERALAAVVAGVRIPSGS